MSERGTLPGALERAADVVLEWDQSHASIATRVVVPRMTPVPTPAVEVHPFRAPLAGSQ